MTKAASRASSTSSLSSAGDSDGDAADASPSMRPTTPTRANTVTQSVAGPPPLSPQGPSPISEFRNRGRKIKTYKRRHVMTSVDASLTSPDTTPRKPTPRRAAPTKTRRPLPAKAPVASQTKRTTKKNKKEEDAATASTPGSGNGSSSELSTPEPTPKRTRPSGQVQSRVVAAEALDEEVDAPLSTPAPHDSEAESGEEEEAEDEDESEPEITSESEPEVMPKRGRRPTVAARKESEQVAPPVPRAAANRPRKRVPRPSTPTTAEPSTKRPRQSLPAKLSTEATNSQKAKEEGALFLEGGSANKPKVKEKDTSKIKRKRASTVAIGKTKSGFLSTDEDVEPTASSSRVTLSGRKQPVARKASASRKKEDDPTSVFERLEAAAIAANGGSFSSHPRTSQTFVDEPDDEEDITLERVLERARQSASLSPPPASTTPTPTKSRKPKNPRTFVPTSLPEG